MNYPRQAFLAAFFTLFCGAARAQFTTVINVPPDAAPASIGDNTQLNLGDGGALPDQFLAGLNPAVNNDVEVNVQGGYVGIGFRANGGSQVNISGGVVDNNFFARGGSTVDFTGGVMAGRLTARPDSEVNLMGGAFGHGFTADGGSGIHVFGNEMRLDGELLAGLDNPGDSLQYDLLNNSVLSGVLADGTPFAFTRIDSDVFQVGTLTLHAVNLPAVGPAQITASTDPVPLGIRGGQTLTVDAGGVVGDYFNAGRGSNVVVDQGEIGDYFETSGVVTINGGAVGDRFNALHGSSVQVNGGSFGNFFQAFADSIVTVSGGTIGSFFEARTGSVVNVDGGTISSQSEANSGATVNVFDGTIGQRFEANSGSTLNLMGGRLGPRSNANSGSLVNVSGGVLDGEFEAFNQSTVNISGGTIRNGFQALSGSNINLFGKEFLLDEAPIAGLVANQPFLLTDRNMVLSGAFEDGSSFDFNLNSGFLNGEDFFQSDAILMLHLMANADFDGNGFVQAADLGEWEAAFGVNADADADFDGDSDGADFLEWQRQLTDGVGGSSGASFPTGASGGGASFPAVAVPEPATGALLLCAAMSLAAVRRRRRSE